MHGEFVALREKPKILIFIPFLLSCNVFLAVRSSKRLSLIAKWTCLIPLCHPNLIVCLQFWEHKVLLPSGIRAFIVLKCQDTSTTSLWLMQFPFHRTPVFLFYYSFIFSLLERKLFLKFFVSRGDNVVKIVPSYIHEVDYSSIL